MIRKTATPSARIDDTATHAGLGRWVTSFRVNRRRESSLLITGIVALLVGIGGGVATALAGLPWYGVLILEIVLGAVTLFGVIMLWTGVLFHGVGWWLIHRFEHGFVMERTRGGQMAARYDAVSARTFHYVEPGDSTSESTDHFGLEITLPNGTVCAMAEPDYGAVSELRTLGELCDAGDPTEMRFADAIKKLSDESWGESASTGSMPSVDSLPRRRAVD